MSTDVAAMGLDVSDLNMSINIGKIQFSAFSSVLDTIHQAYQKLHGKLNSSKGGLAEMVCQQ